MYDSDRQTGRQTDRQMDRQKERWINGVNVKFGCGHLHVHVASSSRDAEKGKATTTQQKGKATQHNSFKTVIFSKKNWLARVGLEPTTISDHVIH